MDISFLQKIGNRVARNISNPDRQGLLNFGASLMSRDQYGNRIGLGNAMMNGLQAHLEGRRNAMQMQQQKNLMDLYDQILNRGGTQNMSEGGMVSADQMNDDEYSSMSNGLSNNPYGSKKKFF